MRKSKVNVNRKYQPKTLAKIREYSVAPKEAKYVLLAYKSDVFKGAIPMALTRKESHARYIRRKMRGLMKRLLNQSLRFKIISTKVYFNRLQENVVSLA